MTHVGFTLAIRAAHERGRGTYGQKKIRTELAEQGMVVGRNRIRRLADALRTAYWRKKPKPRLTHHSDRGNQYCSTTYRALQASYGMKTSMSRKGNCWDIAPLESFFGTLKTESLHHYRFATCEQARKVVFEYIEVFYNRIRRHAKIGNQVPADFANRQQSAAQSR